MTITTHLITTIKEQWLNDEENNFEAVNQRSF